ncbi:MAG: nucleotide pyrophosphohydrolase [Patescibacteria group bacterium]
MSLHDIQHQTHDWISQYKEGYWPPHEIMAQMTEEMGEIAREVNHAFGMKKKKATEAENSISNELGDLLFNMSCLANSLGIDLDASFAHTMHKVNTRDKDRFAKK